MDVTLPNGTVIRDVPEGTNKWKIAEVAISRGLAKPEDFGQESANAAEGMGGFQKFRAGWGKAAVDLGRGVGQMIGVVDRQDVKDSRELDAALMETTAGKLGNFGGAVANALPAAFIPGANTVGGAAAIGAGMGLLQPSASTGETLANVGLGGTLAPAGVLGARGGVSLYRAGRSLVQPFTQRGQQQIAAGTLQAFAGGSNAARTAAQNIDTGLQKPILPGVQPTAAELANNPGVAQLERTLRNNPEYITPLAERNMANKDAMMDALDSIAGTPQTMAAAKSARGAATNQLYESAGGQMVQSDAQLIKMLSRPSVRTAWKVANDLALENGEVLPDFDEFLRRGTQGQPLDISGQTLHYLKLAMDDIADNPATSGLGRNQSRAIGGTRNELVQWIGQKIPDYDQARTTYSAMSKPINQMEIGQAFRNKLQPALADFGASSRTRAAAYAEALRGGDEFAANTLGRSNATLKNIMEPAQMDKLGMIAEQLGRRANADELGRAVGSPTGQNLISQNVLRQILGPLGLPESTIQRAAESTLLQSMMRPVQFAGQLGQERIMQHLARAALDPKISAELLRLGIDPRRMGVLLRNQQFVGPALVSGTNAARQ